MKKLLITLPFLLFSSPLIAQEAPMTVQERSDAGLAIIPNEPPKYKPGEQLESAKVELGLGELELIATASSADPFSRAYQYKGASTDLLYKMFEDRRLNNKWWRVAKVISIVSEDSGLLKLKEYIITPDTEGKEGRFRQRSRSTAMAALIEEGEERDLGWTMPFAIEYTSTEAWLKSIPSLKSRDAKSLAYDTVRAIARLRSPEAVKALEEIRDKNQNKVQVVVQSKSSEQKQFEELVKRMLSHAKGENKDKNHTFIH